MSTHALNYYALRAREFEEVYQKPERQSDLAQLRTFLGGAFPGQSVLEVACGTGYWTQVVAKAAAAILATDINPEVLAIARRKPYGSCCVTFMESDAYSLRDVPPGHDAAFHAFWWSHIPLRKVRSFLATFHVKLIPGTRIIMADNRYVEGSSTPISRRDEQGNTYQIRELEDGSEHEVLKNFPSLEALWDVLLPFAEDVDARELNYYWVVEYRTKGSAEQCLPADVEDGAAEG